MAEEQRKNPDEEQRKNPDSLFNLSLSSYVNNLSYNVPSIDRFNITRFLPPKLLIAVYLKMNKTPNLGTLVYEHLCDLELFGRLLLHTSIRQELFQCISSLPHGGKMLANNLQARFIMQYTVMPKLKDVIGWTKPGQRSPSKVFTEEFDMEAVRFGLILGTFLFDAGWWTESISVLSCVSIRLEYSPPEYSTLLLRLDCFQRLLQAESCLCNFNAADRYYKGLEKILTTLGPEKIPTDLLATMYTQMSTFYFARSEYTQSQQYGTLALQHLQDTSPPKIFVDVLRQTAKACTVKREFKRANLLIAEALKRAKSFFGDDHQKYADALLDYGFFLLNIDAVSQSVQVYEEALHIKQQIFGTKNFQVAVAHEDLSYAYYVQEYTSGSFDKAHDHVDRAIGIMQTLINKDHMMLASSKRVKALLLEEIALDRRLQHNSGDEEGLLKQSEALHKSALQQALATFGEENVQTAKHYGNLGRLYQTMNRYIESEMMHKKAIAIKSDLLGPYDYEVGLSVGHLASLYNYHMKKYREAELLYLRSIKISHRLFGKSYSGLEYDYLGLCHVYETIRNHDKFAEYASILENWQVLRAEQNMHGAVLLQRALSPESFRNQSMDDLIKMFNDMEAKPHICEEDDKE